MRAGVQFLFGQFVPHCEHRIDKHFDYCVLQYMDGGSVSLRVGDAETRLDGRQFWSSYPGPRVRFRAAAPARSWVHRYLAFTGPVVKQWEKAGLFPVPPQPAPPREEYAARFDLLLELSRRDDAFGIARATLLLETILTELAEARSRPHALPAWLEPGLARITTMGEVIDFDDLAAEAGLSPRTYRRRFREATGTSPQAYHIAARVGHAKELLGATDLPIKSIAEQLGYQDVSYFTKQFTRQAGISPGAYRRSREA